MGKLRRSVLGLPVGRWLGWRKSAPMLAGLFVALALLFTACVYTPPPQVTESATEAVPVVKTVLEEQSIPVGNTGESSVEVLSDLAKDPLELEPEAILAAHEAVLTGIYDRLVPSVVQVRAFSSFDRGVGGPNIPRIPFNFGLSGGSGFVWDDRGRIVTNHHVIDGADRITVTFADRTELQAEVLGSDPDSDLAVLQVEDTDYPMPAVELGDSSTVQPGHFALALGNPFGQEFTITDGIISAVGRTIRSGNSQFSIPQVIQTDAPINPGNSGGPLLDRRGWVIGVTTQIISQTGANSGIGFAVPVNTAKRVIPSLIETGKYEYSWLGISGASVGGDMANANGLPRDTRGALIIEVAPDGPAAQGGIVGSESMTELDDMEFPVGGDIVVAVNGTSIEDMGQLITYLIDHTRPGDEIQAEVIRYGGERATLIITLGTRPGFGG